MAGFSQELSLTGAPATGNVGLLAAAGQSRGQAAEVGGKATANLVESLGKTAIAAGAAKGEAMAKESVAAMGEEVAKVASKTYLPDQMYAGSEITSTIFTPKEQIDPSLKNSKAELDRIKAAADQGAIRGSDAAIWTESIIKKYGSLNPHLLTEYRKQAADTWQTSVYGQAGKETHDLLISKQRNDEATKLRAQYDSQLFTWATTGTGADLAIQMGVTPEKFMADPHLRMVMGLAQQAESGRTAAGKRAETERVGVASIQARDELTNGPMLKGMVENGSALVGAHISSVYNSGDTFDEIQGTNGKAQVIATAIEEQRIKERTAIGEARKLRNGDGTPMFNEEYLTKYSATREAYWDFEKKRLNDRESYNALSANYKTLQTQVGTAEATRVLANSMNKLFADFPELSIKVNAVWNDLNGMGLSNWYKQDFITEKDMERIRPVLSKHKLPESDFLRVQHGLRINDFEGMRSAQEDLIKRTGGNKQAIAAEALQGNASAQTFMSASQHQMDVVTPEQIKADTKVQNEFATNMDAWLHASDNSTGFDGSDRSLIMLNGYRNKIEALPEPIRAKVETSVLNSVMNAMKIDKTGSPVDVITKANSRLEAKGLGKGSIELVFDKATNKLVGKTTDYAGKDVPFSVEGLLNPLTGAAKLSAKQQALKDIQPQIDKLNTYITWINYYGKRLDKPMSTEAISKSYAKYIDTFGYPEHAKQGVRSELPAVSPQITPTKVPTTAKPTASNITKGMQAGLNDLQDEIATLKDKLGDVKPSTKTYLELQRSLKEAETTLKGYTK